MERMLAGLSTRRYGMGLEPVGVTVEAASSATSKSAVSRKFVAMTETTLGEPLAADLSGLDLSDPPVRMRPSPQPVVVLRSGLLDSSHTLLLLNWADRSHRFESGVARCVRRQE